MAATPVTVTTTSGSSLTLPLRSNKPPTLEASCGTPIKGANGAARSVLLVASPQRKRTGAPRCFPRIETPTRPARTSTSETPFTPDVPRSSRRSFTSPASQVASLPLEVKEAGAGGVEEMAQKLPAGDASVSWGLLRFQVGRGTFQRMKLVALHFNGQATPVMMRGWLNARSSDAASMLGDVHASIEVTRTEDLTLEKLCDRLLPVFAGDNLGHYSAATLQKEYREAIAEAQRKQAEAKVEPVKPEPVCAPEVDDTLPKTAEEAMRATGLDGGDVNWVLVEPEKLTLHKTGRGGIEEMKDALDPAKVLFGVLRLSFGGDAAGTVGFSKCVFVHWVGPRVGVVKRGIWNAKLQTMTARAHACCAIAMRKEAHSPMDLTIEDLIAELRRLTVLDGVCGAGSRLTVASYHAALEQEAQRRLRKAEEPVVVAEPEVVEEPARPDLSTAIASVRQNGGALNWVLCSCADLPAAIEQPMPRRMFS